MRKDTVKATDYIAEQMLLEILEFIVFLVCAVGMILLKPALAWLWLLLTSISCLSFYFVFFGSKKRFLMRIGITEDYYRSYYRKKEYCTVSKTETIYYAIFKNSQATKSEVPYITLSNYYFTLGGKAKERLSTYDMTHEIIIQYNQTTWHLFDVENWVCVGGEELVHKVV